MKNRMKLLVLGAGALLLGGCQALQDVGAFLKSEVTNPPAQLVTIVHGVADAALGIAQAAVGIAVKAIFPF